jgi:hypothetical protein
MKRTLIAFALIPAALAAPAWAECYTIYQRNVIVYRSEITPIDLEGPIHVALQKRFPGGQLVISGDVRNCSYIDPASPVDPATGAAASPPAAVVTVAPAPGGVGVVTERTKPMSTSR